MRGRPKRRAHDELIHLLQEERRRAGASLRKIAKLMDVDPSTLSRSLAQQAFSPDMAEKAQALLKAGIPGSDTPSEERSPCPSESPLLILHKFADMMPQVESALRSMLGTQPVASRRDA